MCRKGFYSINCQVVCSAELVFLDVTASWPGSTHDATVWKYSGIKKIIEQFNGQGWFIGDSGYLQREVLMTPLVNPTTQ